MQISLSESNALANFLQSLRANKLSYGYSHSYLCSLILHKIIDSFEWESPQIKEKLTFLAYFYDISLKENLMPYNSETSVADSDLSRDEKSMVLNHANQSAAIVSKFPNGPEGMATIIREHHGSKNGVGFPESLSISISPISMMFVVVEHFVEEFLKIEGNPQTHQIEAIFKMLQARYNKVTYGQTLVALQGMILNKKK